MTTHRDQLILQNWSQTRRVWRITTRIERAHARLQKAQAATAVAGGASPKMVVDVVALLEELRENCRQTTSAVMPSAASYLTPHVAREILENERRWALLDALIGALLSRLDQRAVDAQINDLSANLPALADAVYAWSSERFDILRRALMERRRGFFSQEPTAGSPEATAPSETEFSLEAPSVT